MINDSISFNGRKLGPDCPAYIVAEIGINHNGDIDLAKKMILSAKQSGVDAVKFQNYKTEDFIFDKTQKYTYISNGVEITESQWDMFRRCELNDDAVKELKIFCDEICIDFISTPTNPEGVRLLFNINVPAFKNGSDFMANTKLIECFATYDLPLVLSTGMSSFDEISHAVNAYENAGGRELILLHCVSCYPTKLDEVNLNRMTLLASKYRKIVGFSDHTIGSRAAIVAVSMGACFIEKHFTTDRKLQGPDHSFSSTPEEMKQLVEDIRSVETIKGKKNAKMTEDELVAKNDFRLSCVAKRDMQVGEIVDENDVIFRRPGTGMQPNMITDLVGRKLRVQIKEGQQFIKEMF